MDDWAELLEERITDRDSVEKRFEHVIHSCEYGGDWQEAIAYDPR